MSTSSTLFSLMRSLLNATRVKLKKWLYVLGDVFCYSFTIGIFLSRSAFEVGVHGIFIVIFLLAIIDFKGFVKSCKNIPYRDHIFYLALLLMVWLFISYVLRNVDVRPEYYFKKLNQIYSAFLMPLLGVSIYIFLSAKKFDFFKKLILIGSISMLVNSGLGFINYFTGPNAFTDFLGLRYHKYRLISYHFYIVTASLSGQLYFILFFPTLIAWIDLKKNKKNSLYFNQKIYLLYVFILILFPITLALTWAKFLIFYFCLLLVPTVIIAFFMMFPRYQPYKWRCIFLLLTAMFLLGSLASNIVLMTENPFSRRYVKMKKALETRDMFKADEFTRERFIYIRNGMRMFKSHPLTGVGMFGFIDYMADNYIGESISLRRKTYRYTASHPHNDFIGLIAQVGLVGFFIYYALLGSIAWRCYIAYRKRAHERDEHNFYALGLLFGLLFLIGNGVTDSNFQHVHMLILSFHIIAALLLKKKPFKN